MKKVGTTEFAGMVGVTTRTVYNWVKSGKIKPLCTLTGRWVFTEEHYRQVFTPPGSTPIVLKSLKRGQ